MKIILHSATLKDIELIDINALHLEVARNNDVAQRLYGKAGFEAREKYMLMSVELRKHDRS